MIFNWDVDCLCHAGYYNSSYNYANNKYYGQTCTYEYSPYSDGRPWCYIGGHVCSDYRSDSGSNTIYIGSYSGTGWYYSYLGCKSATEPSGIFISSNLSWHQKHVSNEIFFVLRWWFDKSDFKQKYFLEFLIFNHFSPLKFSI